MKKYKILPIFLIFFITTEINIVFASAKHITSSNGSTIVQIAKFDVVASNITEEKNLVVNKINQVAEYEFSIKNNSDVGVVYSIVLELPTKLPDDLDAKIYNEQGNVFSATIDEQGKKYTFENVRNALPNESETKYKLKFERKNLSKITEDLNLTDIKIKAYVTQSN